MPFDVSESTLESLEWARLVDRLRMACRTPQGRLLLADASGEAVFAAEESEVRIRLRETSEARDLLDRDAIAPLSAGCADLTMSLAHAEKGGVLEPALLIEVRTTLDTMHATLRFFDHHREQTPTLAALADTFGNLVLEVDPEKDGQVEGGRWALDASFCFLALGRLRCRANERLVHVYLVSCRSDIRRQTKREERTSSCYPKGPKFFHDCPFVKHHALPHHIGRATRLSTVRRWG